MATMLNTNQNTFKPTLVFFVGLMGSGKSYWGKLLAKKNNWNYIDLDNAIEQQEKMTIGEIFKKNGEAYFRNIETTILQQLLKNTTDIIPKNTIIATGGGTACHNNNIDWMNRNGVTIWLNENIEKIEYRVYHNKQKRPLLNTILDKDLLDYLDLLLQSRKIFYAQSQYCINSDGINENNIQSIIDKYV